MENTITTFHYKHVYYRLLSISNIIIVHYKHDMCKVDVKHETDIIKLIGRNNHSATKVLSVSLTSLLYDSTRHIINHYKAINHKDTFSLV